MIFSKDYGDQGIRQILVFANESDASEHASLLTLEILQYGHKANFSKTANNHGIDNVALFKIRAIYYNIDLQRLFPNEMTNAVGHWVCRIRDGSDELLFDDMKMEFDYYRDALNFGITQLSKITDTDLSNHLID